MTRRNQTTWPNGTPKSQGNAFTAWRTDVALGIDSSFAAEYPNCTSLYNQWRSAQRAGHGKGYGQTWAQFRDSNQPQSKNYKDNHIGAKPAGFRANGGTITGLSDKADAMLAAQGKLMSITASAWNGSVVKPPHEGAYSRAGTRGGSAKIHQPARKATKPGQLMPITASKWNGSVLKTGGAL